MFPIMSSIDNDVALEMDVQSSLTIFRNSTPTFVVGGNGLYMTTVITIRDDDGKHSH